MTLEDTIIAGAVTGAAKVAAERFFAKKPKEQAELLREELQIREAENLLLKSELRNALLRHAKELLPAAIEQARGSSGAKHKNGRPKKGERPSPALLRLISSMVFRNVKSDAHLTKGKR